MNNDGIERGLCGLKSYQAITSGIILTLSAFTLRADDVFLVQETPEPEALVQLMFPKQQAQQRQAPKYKLRGIRFQSESTDLDGGENSSDNGAHNSTSNHAGKEPPGTAVGFNIQFAFNSQALLPQTLPYLDAVGEMLLLEQARDAKLAIVGHADASGSSAHNLTLSRSRAAEVARYIQTKFDIDGQRLTIRGDGEGSPLPNADPYDAMNRRVEFHPLP